MERINEIRAAEARVDAAMAGLTLAANEAQAGAPLPLAAIAELHQAQQAVRNRRSEPYPGREAGGRT